jgi:hypothetical protein
MAKTEDTDPRHVARAEELKKQAEQQKLMDEFHVQQKAEAEAAAKAQAQYELTGIRVVEGKP